VFEERFCGIPWSVLALAALGIAVVYLFIDTSAGATGLRWLIARWTHSLCWLLLAVAALAMSKLTPLPAAWAGPIGATGGALYLAFIVTTLSGRD
jgi:hypothetical protein